MTNMLNITGTSPGEVVQPRLNEALCKRLVMAKIQLDRLEGDGSCKDLSALSAARVEFALASRALADALIAQEE
ncbi:hypothetical protein HOP62_11040 [Halomonas sp. MCCC 1A17488]|uniref:Uncharacterized protein n=1 Tax=Billgrantia sulfidoxydans TaxID=2733484 RepID=A0ABX7W4A8_9GAMM|nr:MULTISPECIES: hypothetical protein [Halomonas]MCE8016605.1 hypothetical protein [Halomonas sp. MCCC 1A17488]MCG3239938.1 hypothetical protein [Halomonas sp. MCCC 1A17488]QPP50170.1 hypothetical protein I4484_03330 [Halomonas sp. SS10-MC5]QTP53789.1 hypothetical protein HNO51_03300 [Halomonas sulfidoxydans]